MYEYLKELDEGINERYLTAMRNVRSASNSFYDSYLDLLEETLKAIADKYDCVYDERLTCGQLVKKSEMREILLNTIGVSEKTYGKFSDYSQKINRHKHHLEKKVSVDAIINYMKVYDELISRFASKLGFPAPAPLDVNYLVEQFGRSEKENKRLKEEAESLREELIKASEEKQLSEANKEKLEKILKGKSEANADLEEENLALSNEINRLKDIKLNSLETKLDKTIGMLEDLQDYLAESRISISHISKLICGVAPTDEELREERKKMETAKHGK